MEFCCHHIMWSCFDYQSSKGDWNLLHCRYDFSMLLTKLDKIFTLFYTNQDFHIFSIPVVARERTDCLLWIKQFCEKTLRWKILSWLKNVDTSIHIKQKKKIKKYMIFFSPFVEWLSYAVKMEKKNCWNESC